MAEVATNSTSPKSKKPPTTKKPTKAPKVSPLTLAEIENLAGGPIDFNDIYARSDESVRKKLFATAAAQQLRDQVNQWRGGKSPKPLDELPALIHDWLPTVKRRGIGFVAKASKIVASMSAEERAELAKLLNG